MKTYNGKNKLLIINGIPVSGFDESDMFTIARAESVFEEKVGADGELTRQTTNNRTGTVVIKLLYSSNANAVLSDLLGLDETAGAGTFSFLFQDLDGESLAAGARCYVKGWPETAIGKEVPALEWTVVVEDLKLMLGGL